VQLYQPAQPEGLEQATESAAGQPGDESGLAGPGRPDERDTKLTFRLLDDIVRPDLADDREEVSNWREPASD
jgi:hypothetical protein